MLIPKALQAWTLRLGLLLFLLGISAACASAPNPAPTPAGPSIALTPCQLSAPLAATRLPAKCGTLTVPENRAAPNGRKLDLRIAVLPSISRTPAPDPLVFITGGPGEAATQDYVMVSPGFRLIGQNRDIVLVDQRGTGGSHLLTCSSLENVTNEANSKTWAEACVKQLDADLRYYTTFDAVDDLDQVRAALGYDKLNLYGVSYGTRVAQTYLRRYPEHVRSLILDGVVSPKRPLGLTMASDAQRALNMIFARCAADPSCHQAFPDVAGDFTALLADVSQTSIGLTITHPTTGKATPVTFTRSTLATTMRLFSYSAETAALLPLLVHNARVTGDLSAVAAQALIVSKQVEGSMSLPVHNSVVCSEDVPLYSQYAPSLAAGEKSAYMGESYKELQALCQSWPTNPVPAEMTGPVRSDVPVLLLSGEADPVTPPINAEQVAATLPHSLQLVAPGQGHSIILRGCTYRIASDFVSKGSVDGLDTKCVKDIKPLPFFTSLTGTAP